MRGHKFHVQASRLSRMAVLDQSVPGGRPVTTTLKHGRDRLELP